ncbi:hypothetical protein BUE93_15680 [Chromobacterium amazonense]|uniref:Bacteriophage lambda Replication protein O N-terminal domain-containing protein n=1 Tax=Chromobacterium amazonense TaxID=1382803 RepID=A0A2S9X1U9_9NEIS|nr:hypothetical protein [Chromobacterium amazonense]PRP69663.1 hypothetical protein BUE93_15680 [Chromobacterium amazonense]
MQPNFTPLAGMAELLVGCRIEDHVVDQLSEKQKLIYTSMQRRKRYSFSELMEMTGGALTITQARRAVYKLQTLHLVNSKRINPRINSHAVYWRN